MKVFEEQNKDLVEFDKSFDSNDFNSCVNRAILLIKNREAQMIEEGYYWPIVTEACKWSVEQAIINRRPGTPMMAAAIEYVEVIEHRAEDYNGI